MPLIKRVFDSLSFSQQAKRKKKKLKLLQKAIVQVKSPNNHISTSINILAY